MIHERGIQGGKSPEWQLLRASYGVGGLCCALLASVGQVAAQMPPRIDLQHVQTIPQAASRWAKAAFQNGLLAIAPLAEGELMVVDTAGTALSDFEGIVTSGRANVSLQWAGDTLVIFDPGQRSAIGLTESGDTAFERRIEPAVTYRLAPGAAIAFTSHARTPDRVGYPWHTLSRAGEWRSHGDLDHRVMTRSNVWDFEWKLASTSDSIIWTHYRTRLRIEAWSLDGKKLRAISDEPAWIQQYPREDARYYLAPSVHAVHVGEELVWILGHVLQSGWETAWKPDSSLTAQNENDVLDTVIEIRERATGEVWARSTFDCVMKGFTQEGHIYGLKEKDGELQVAIWEVRIHPNEGEENHVEIDLFSCGSAGVDPGLNRSDQRAVRYVRSYGESAARVRR